MLSRRSKINIALFLLVSSLAAIITLLPPARQMDPLPPLTRLNSDAIQVIKIVNRQGKTIQLERSATGWTMTAPYAARADQARIEGLLRIASTPSYLQIPANEQDLAVFGLASPEATLQLNDTELRFGSTEPVHYRRYVLTRSGIGLIDDGFYHHLMAKPEDFLAPQGAVDPGDGAD